MKALLLLLVSFPAFGQEYVLILPTPSPYQPRTQLTITPNGTYHTFSNGNASTTVGPEGTYHTFGSKGATITLTPSGRAVIAVQSPPRY